MLVKNSELQAAIISSSNAVGIQSCGGTESGVLCKQLLSLSNLLYKSFKHFDIWMIMTQHEELVFVYFFLTLFVFAHIKRTYRYK